jgi:hypothetical protein
VDAIASAFSASASGSGGPNSPEAKAALANSVATASGLGLYRSQGLQYLRDQTFQLCIRAMETGMTMDEWDRSSRNSKPPRRP